MKFKILLLIFVCAAAAPAKAQQVQKLSLQQAIDSALANNHLLKIKSLQEEEKKVKVLEDAVKKYPSATATSLYQYNPNVGQFIIPQGSLGTISAGSGAISFPESDKFYDMGKHHLFFGGISLYQPITQQGKIKTGLEIDKTDVLLAQKEKENTALQIKQGVEKIYYGMLINEKQQKESNAKLELAKLKLYDVQSALQAGKTFDANIAGLQANIAEEEMNEVKLQIQQDDYISDLKFLTGITADNFQLEEMDTATLLLNPEEQYKTSAAANNIDVSIANLGAAKTQLAIKVAKQNNVPDIGLTAGYTFQKTFSIYPAHTVSAGVHFSWNLQDLFSNKQVLKQRNLLLQQAKENIANTQEQLNASIEKAYRKVLQAQALINVAVKVVYYRRNELKIQEDKRAAGLNTPADLLSAKAGLAKSEADLYAAQLSSRLALSELNILSEGK